MAVATTRIVATVWIAAEAKAEEQAEARATQAATRAAKTA